MIARRAQWRMGTLVEAGADLAPCALDAAFGAIAAIESRMSRFRASSDLARLNAAPVLEPVTIHAHTLAVLALAAKLFDLTGGAFDAALGRGRGTPGFRCDASRAWRTQADATLSLDGIAKGYAVDRAVAALQEAGASCGWVNAGGDLRVFGAFTIDVERRAGRDPATIRLRDRAMATSEYGPRRRMTSTSTLSGRRARPPGSYGASVLARECAVADALTKAVSVAGRRALRWARALDAEVIWRA
jgi:thiamine biosynthesis lipoprotein